jgi:hypothetical protein
MRKTIFALTSAAVALTTTPAVAQPTVAKGVTCTKYVNGVCTQTHRVKYKVGYVFGPNFAYTPISGIPPAVVTQYSLGDNYRYVYSDGYVYVIDPTTYAVTRVIAVPGS